MPQILRATNLLSERWDRPPVSVVSNTLNAPESCFLLMNIPDQNYYVSCDFIIKPSSSLMKSSSLRVMVGLKSTSCLLSQLLCLLATQVSSLPDLSNSGPSYLSYNRDIFVHFYVISYKTLSYPQSHLPLGTVHSTQKRSQK